ncbi:MAG: hypothetical protein C0592_06120 [Marinilabiliales bacterium]|nr:MAG: hypothetical protein C0592_06120 [Marinilabiliales bacterium]
MRFSVKILSLVFATLVLLASSCRKDPSWDVSVKTPLFNSNLGIEDLVTDSLIQINPDSSVSVIFNQELFALTADSIIGVPDSLYYMHFIIPIGLQAPPGALVMEKTESKHYDMDGAKITEMKIKSGNLVVRAFNYVGDDAFIEYSLDNSLLYGSPVMVSGLIPSFPVTGEHLYQEFDISGMYLDLRGSYLHCNALTSTLKVYANPYATSPVVINYGDSIDILVEFQDIVLDYARGYFGQYEFDEADITEFDIFEDLSIDAIDLDNVDMTVEIINSIGTDASFQLKHLEGIGQSTVALNSPWVGKTINIARAIENPPGSGIISPSTLTMDFSGSNVEEFIENLPSTLSYGMKGQLNPLGNISTGNDFVFFGQGFKAMARMEIPLNIAFSNLMLIDTVEFDLTHSESYIHESILYLDVSNGFPLSVSFRIDLLNEANSIIDSLIPDSDVQSAPVDGSGRVTEPLISHIEIYLNEIQTMHLYDAKKAVITAVFNTGSAGQKVKFYADYRLIFSVSGLFDYHIDS